MKKEVLTNTKREIVLCEYCKGKGFKAELVDYHKKEYMDIECDICKGKGRLICEIITKHYRLENK